MAQQVITTLVDDLDGGTAQETVIFALDGRTFEIDLNEANDTKLREFLAPYIAAGRRVSGGRKPGQTATRSTGKSAGDVDPQTVRAWAKENGVEVSDRGRVAGSVVEAYKKATQ
jgi:hypothetical protein